MIQNDADGIISLDEMKAMQGDNYNLKADFLIPALQGLSFDDAHMRELVDWLAAWDRQNDVDSGEAVLFEAFWVSFLAKAFADDLGFVPDGGSLYWYLASQMIANPAHLVYGAIWDDSTTPDVKETANEILAAAFTEAVAAVSEAQGDDPAAWSWGHVHIAYFEHELFGSDADLSATFNAQVATGGGNSIVNATGWSADNVNPFEVESLPSMRQLLIPQAWDSSLRANTFGQSGDPDSPHHHDQMEMWAAVEYHPDWFSRAAVEADAATVWQLTP
jgi:penicillin amidase